MIETHNQFLSRKKRRVGDGYKVFPYLVDEKTLRKRKKIPKELKNIDFYSRNISAAQFNHVGDIINGHRIPEYVVELVTSSDLKEEEFRRVCRNEVTSDIPDSERQCLFLHHNDPYLMLGPFKLEVHSRSPLRTVMADFFTEVEMDWLIEYSKPRLSAARGKSEHKVDVPQAAQRYSKKGVIIHKTVQCWINERETETPKLTIDRGESDQPDDDFVILDPLQNPDWYIIKHPILHRLAKKIEIATRMNITARWSSTEFQTTNYGLGGLCETHLDPHGYLDGVEVPKSRASLFLTGDMLATVMGWLEDVPAGGATAFDWPGKEIAIQPTKGSIAFWFNLKKNGSRNRMTSHGGCPVIVGSKWILNKWIFFFNQWKTHPCSLDRGDEHDLDSAFLVPK